jgi:uncharacterized protein (TIGR02099 family)
VASVLFVGWLSLHWLILPHIEEWRAPIEARASSMLGAPVRIGAIVVQSSRWVPAFELRDVEVLDAEKRVALALPRVYAALSVRSLLALEPRFSQLLIDGASVDVRRDASGHIRVAGLDFGSSTGDAEDDAAVDWFFKQHEFVIRGGSVRWIDEARQAPPLVLGEVDLVVRNGLREHAIRLDATPPPGWGERFTLRGLFTQPLFAGRGDWRRWSGSAYADLPRADLRELRRHVTLPFELSEGDGSVRGWFDVEEGQPIGATVDVALRAVTLRLHPTVEPLEFEQIEGRITGERRGDRVAVAARRFGFLTGNGVRWPRGDLDVAWTRDAQGEVRAGELVADRLDVGLMADIAMHVPMGAALRGLLADVRPQGVITKLNTRWDGPLDAPAHYRVKGLLSGLSLVARPAAERNGIGRPGLTNATVQLDASEAGGEARIGIAGGVLDLPGVFAERELPLDRFDARLAWKVDPAPAGRPPQITVKAAGVSFANRDAEGQLSATWRSGRGDGFARGGRYPGELELDGVLANGKGARTARYLPLGLPEGVRSYIDGAVRSGTIRNAVFRVRGDLWDFPFHNARTARDGEFRIAAKVEDAVFAYVPAEPATVATSARPAQPRRESAWPALSAVTGELIVDRSSLEILNATARLAGAEWKGIHGRIADLGGAARLDIEGTARGPLPEMLRFVNGTPVGGWTGEALAKASATGPAELRLGLSIPLDDPAATQVKGGLQLLGNDVRMTPDTPLLAAAKARIDFTHQGFSVASASARLLGGELAFSGGSVAQPSGKDLHRFTGQGTFSAEALRQASELGTLARLASTLSGHAGYRATVAFIGGRPQIELSSDLVGIAVDLPQPLGKPATAPLALRLHSGPEEGSAPGGDGTRPNRDVLRVDVGGAVQAHFLREQSGEATRVVRGAIRVGEPRPAGPLRAGESAPSAGIEVPPLPPAGTVASVTLRQLDVAAWESVLDRLDKAGDRPPPGTPAAPLVFDPSGGEGYVPESIALRVGDLDLGSRRLRNVTAGLSQQAGLWRANVEADELAGYVEYRPARRGSAAGAGRVYARLARLSLPRGEAERVESLLDEQPASIPALDIVVDDFDLRGKRLGRLEIEAVNRGATREWQLAKLNLVTPEARLTATGSWGASGSPGAPAPRRATMSFTLALADSGAYLERLGMGRVVRGGKGSLAGDLAWVGSPLSPDLARMTGQVKVAIDSGQFLKASPGAARLLGVFTLQSLPRRLLFDFRDLFEEGFAFDNVVGDIRIGGGLASTNNLRMRGAAAAVLMEGSADLVRETEDLRVVVVPEINAGTASLAYAVINPAVGLGTFLAQYFLRKPLMAANTREFHITGPWDDPKVERVERSKASEAAMADTPPASPPPAESAPATPR